jgi:hypothetical protein
MGGRLLVGLAAALLLLGNGDTHAPVRRSAATKTTTSTSSLSTTSCASAPSSSHGENDRYAPGEREAREDQYRAPLVVKQNCGACDCKAGADTQGRRDQGDINWPNWIAALATTGLLIVGAIVACYQWRLMHGSYRAARDAANAATVSADAETTALRSLERPWLIVRVEGPDAGEKDVLSLLGTATTGDFPLHLPLKWSASNHGRTPAWIVCGTLYFRPIDTPLPPYPLFDVLDEGEEFGQMPVTIDKPHVLKTGRYLAKDDYDKIRAREAILLFYGTLVYRDVFNHIHTTRFCWEWKRPAPEHEGGLLGPVFEFGPGGLPEWTEYT